MTSKHRPRPANRDTNRLATYLHGKAEEQKTALARDIHDNLGGLIVAALMDVAWAEQNLPELATASQGKLARVRRSLHDAIDLKRKIIEELRPTLLDNVGILSALNWLLKKTRDESGVDFTVKFPEGEPALDAAAAIGLFRFVEELLVVVTRDNSVKSIDLQLQVENSAVSVMLTHDGHSAQGWSESRWPEILSLKHRVRTLGGTVTVTKAPTGHSVISAVVPIVPALETDPPPEDLN